MGAIGGGVWNSVKGARNSPRGIALSLAFLVNSQAAMRHTTTRTRLKAFMTFAVGDDVYIDSPQCALSVPSPIAADYKGYRWE